MTTLKAKPGTMPAKRTTAVAKVEPKPEFVPGAVILTTPAIVSAAISESFGRAAGGVEISAMQLLIERDLKAIKGGDLSRIEEMLFGQAVAMQAMFLESSRRAATQENLKLHQAHMGWAMKAQAQSRATLQALVELKQPRSAVFVKQQNIGEQQQIAGGDINNAPASHAKESATSSNKLLEAQDGEWVDTGTSRTTGRTNPHLEAVGENNRAEERKRKAAG